MIHSKRLLTMLLVCAMGPALAQIANAPTAPSAASFECAKARGRIEKAICADSALATLDRKVAELFALANAQGADPGDLKRAQRRWLGDRNDCKETQCIADSYAHRIVELGALTGHFSNATSTALCTQFLEEAPRKTLLATTAGIEDINNDGRADRASTCSGGTANIPCVEYADDSGKPLAILPDGFQWMTYSAFGRAPFRYDGHTFTYYSSDGGLEQPAFISYVTPTNHEVRVCDFDTSVGSAVSEGGDEVCAAVEAAGDALEILELAPIADESSYGIARRDTRPRALGAIDIDNDGLDEDLIELQYSSVAARGCEINYFELLTEDRRSLAANSNAAAVRTLQGLSSDGPDARGCGVISNRLLRFGDKVYFDSNSTNAAGTPHELRILEGEAISEVCSFERQVRTRIKTLY